MKKILNLAMALLMSGILAAGFVSCSSPSGSSSSGDSDNGGNTSSGSNTESNKHDSSSKVVIAKYSTETGYGTDYIIGYEDGTYDEIWGGEVWSYGTYTINYGDMLNGSVTTKVSWAREGQLTKAGEEETFTIIEGVFKTTSGHKFTIEGGKVSERKKLITFKAKINGFSDYVLIYDDGTWAETYAGMYVFSKGTYTITDGTIENGTVKLNVTWADSSISVKPGTYTVEIKNASFDFNGYTYKKK